MNTNSFNSRIRSVWKPGLLRKLVPAFFLLFSCCLLSACDPNDDETTDGSSGATSKASASVGIAGKTSLQVITAGLPHAKSGEDIIS